MYLKRSIIIIIIIEVLILMVLFYFFSDTLKLNLSIWILDRGCENLFTFALRLFNAFEEKYELHLYF